MKINLDIKKFYLLGAGLFACVIFFNIWNLVISWKIWNLPMTLSFIFGSIFFQLLLCVFFIYMWKNTPDMITDDKSLDKIMEEYI